MAIFFLTILNRDNVEALLIEAMIIAADRGLNSRPRTFLTFHFSPITARRKTREWLITKHLPVLIRYTTDLHRVSCSPTSYYVKVHTACVTSSSFSFFLQLPIFIAGFDPGSIHEVSIAQLFVRN